MKFINRKIESEAKRLIKYFPILTVTGPRQSGKTTLCRNIFPDYKYYNLEDQQTLDLVMTDPKSFLKNSNNGIVFDEAQNYPQLFSQIQVVSDENPNRKFVLSGSSNFALLQNITQSLAGRTSLLTLLPFSIKELGNSAESENTDKLILKGGYPRLWSEPDFPTKDFFSAYYSTYVERDVRQIVNIKDIHLFRKFIRLCAGRIGCEFNASSLSNEVGVAVGTINNWISILSASYIVFMLQPYFENIGKRLIKTPKLYFYDTGLAAWLLGIENESQLDVHPLRGQLFENLVITEVLKECLNSGKEPYLFFYRDRPQNEVDLIHVIGNDLECFEIKSSETFNLSFIKGLKYFRKLFGDRVRRSTVIYDGKTLSENDPIGIINFRDFSLLQ